MQFNRRVLAVRVQVRPRHAPTLGRVPVEGHDESTVSVSNLIDSFDCADLPEAMSADSLNDLPIHELNAYGRKPASTSQGDNTGLE